MHNAIRGYRSSQLAVVVCHNVPFMHLLSVGCNIIVIAKMATNHERNVCSVMVPLTTKVWVNLAILFIQT